MILPATIDLADDAATARLGEIVEFVSLAHGLSPQQGAWPSAARKRFLT